MLRPQRPRPTPAIRWYSTNSQRGGGLGAGQPVDLLIVSRGWLKPYETAMCSSGLDHSFFLGLKHPIPYGTNDIGVCNAPFAAIIGVGVFAEF